MENNKEAIEAEAQLVHQENYFKKLSSSKSRRNYFTQEQYSDFIDDIRQAKSNIPKNLNDKERRRLYHLKDTYDIMQLGNKTRIIKRVKDSYITLVPVEDTFAILDRIHKSLGHKGRDLMLNSSEMSEYANVSVEMIRAYLDNCKYCAENKMRRMTTGCVVKPILSSKFNERAQMDLIDMQSVQDGDFRWIMVYQDHLTKYVVLRALKAKEASGVANELIHIFCLLGNLA